VLALANFIAYITRYSMLDWGPTYLREVKGASLGGGGLAILAVEFGGIPSTILLGWLSDSLGGRRCMIAALCMIPVFGAFLAILFTPAGFYWIDMLMLITIGFFIYPVINLITIAALDIVSKKAIGAAAGFIGLAGYMGRTAQAKGFGWAVDKYEPLHGKDAAWDIVLYSILACGVLAGILLAFTWSMRPRA
jgi:OPA family glycerol-3-phosphate transporter-like MFS transporter